ncbi:hypothetical protein BJY04DRAFT_1785 [Aspergillus karnatakaensis]|uniref:uncharacterized protein n=1 Tax=Aspergillus karnatakaensis TaxID=1810916 RepID=UPI003CCE30F2
MIDKADPFRSLRDGGHLGRWYHQQHRIPWYQLIKPPPVGPIISADLVNGLCGKKTVVISRSPLVNHTLDQAAWATILTVIQPEPRLYEVETEEVAGNSPEAKSPEVATCNEWTTNMELRPLVKHKQIACTMISRTTLMALFCVTNARPVFSYNGAPGYRAAYPCYCGQWRVEWPIGETARVYFSAHDSHALRKDAYPLTFERRVDKCLQMLSGVIDAGHDSKSRCAFPGRQAAGDYILVYTIKGFGGVHGGRHFYNMIGGNVTGVDFLLMKKKSTEQPPETMVLYLPNKDNGELDVKLYIPAEESTILDKALDCLPWSSLSWSIHRGLHDILTAFANKRMDQYRSQLAETLRHTVSKWPEKLISRGWDPRFVREEMADLAVGAVLAGHGNSGDAVRVVTDIALTLWDGPVSELDETFFWRSTGTKGPDLSILDPATVAALVKSFVLEWSIELNYQLYHDFPLELYLG